MRVLYVSHTAAVSGAERSLLVLLGAVQGAFEAHLACPEGELARAAEAQSIPVHRIRGTDVSARLHPLHTSRELVRAAAGARELHRLARRLGADLVHANTPRAAMLAATAAGPGPHGRSLVLHVRDAPPPGRLPAMLFTSLSARSAAWIVTSRFLAERLPAGRPHAARRPVVRIVPNAVEPERFDPAALRPHAARARLGLGSEEPVLGVVGQISPHKAQSDAIDTLARVRAAGVPARLLIVGSVKFAGAATRFDNAGYERECHAQVAALGLEPYVTWLGERDDVAEVMRACDALLVPSWYEPFGRVALEAMMMEVPVLATEIGGVREVVRDGVDGVILAPRHPAAWAQAVLELLGDETRRRAMGTEGRRHALEHYGAPAHGRSVVGLYQELMAENRLARTSVSDSLTAVGFARPRPVPERPGDD